ncbi:MAG TPA: hypothetical protein VKP69_33890, partial [Isosphaeraceae bacterium]|nr:hypothetical protein [Isosphaeraceae bacterium]
MPINAEIEARRQAEQDRLDRLKVSDERNRLGQFATPPALALDIVKYVSKLREGRSESVSFLEPALGTGSFYSALRRVFPSETITEAVGIEIDPAVAGVASALWKKTGLTVIEADFTRLEPDRRFNLILTNPPYVRHHHLIREDKGRLQSLIGRRLRIDISGLAGLYCHFLLLCDAWMEDGGHAAWLIPSEFMDVNYGTAVKEYLTERVRLLRIHRYCPSDAQFGDALVTSAIVVFEKTAPSDSLRVSISFGGSISSPSASEDVPLQILRDSRKWTPYPSHGTKTESHGATLGDFFTIKRGLATGANSFFILERQEA